MIKKESKSRKILWSYSGVNAYDFQSILLHYINLYYTISRNQYQIPQFLVQKWLWTPLNFPPKLSQAWRKIFGHSRSSTDPAILRVPGFPFQNSIRAIVLAKRLYLQWRWVIKSILLRVSSSAYKKNCGTKLVLVKSCCLQWTIDVADGKMHL